MLHILTLTALAINYFEVVFITVFDYDSYDLKFDRAFTMQFFILGVLDIFVSYMLWFLMDENDQPLYMKDNNTGEVYQVLNVLTEDNEGNDYNLNSNISI